MALDVRKVGSPRALNGKTVLVVGLGKSGLSAYRFLRKKGAVVFVTDDAGSALLKKNKLPLSRFLFPRQVFKKRLFDLFVVSPGVPWNHFLLNSARERNIPVLPEFELGWLSLRPQKTVAVTGTNGKTTTTEMVGWVLNQSGRPALVAGNIGRPLTSVAALGKKILVLELSSYQIEAASFFKPDVGVWLNLSPDHLARHKTMRRYARIKASLFDRCGKGQVAILNKRDRWIQTLSAQIKASKKWFPQPGLLRLAKNLPLAGGHNLENAMAAALVALAFRVSPSKIEKALARFKGVPHRLEFIAQKKGVRFINDSKATNVDSTVIALKAVSGPVRLLMGGEHKGSSYKPLRRFNKSMSVKIYAYGQAKNLIKKDLKGVFPVETFQTLAQATRGAAKEAVQGETVLLSPACASFDQFKNFEERGEAFRSLVKKI